MVSLDIVGLTPVTLVGPLPGVATGMVVLPSPPVSQTYKLEKRIITRTSCNQHTKMLQCLCQLFMNHSVELTFLALKNVHLFLDAN